MQNRLLTAARLVGSSALTIVAIFSVEMPGGFLGAANELTTFGSVYAGALVVGTLLVGAGLIRQVDWLRNLVPVAFSVNIGIFVPALITDPLVSALLIIWHLVLLAHHLFPEESEFGQLIDRSRLPSMEPVEKWWDTFGPPARHLVLVSLILTVAVIGFELSEHWVALLVCSVLTVGTIAATYRFVRLMFDGGQRAVVLLAVPVALSVLFLGQPSVVLGLLGVYHALTLVLMIARGPLFAELLATFLDHPAVLIAAAFVSIILLGTLLLTFPAASATGTAIDAIDALFTATSATCVTGLIVLDTPHDFTLFGHVVILSLIQIGGLGIMVLSTFGAVIIGGKLGLRGERALGEALDIHDPRTAYRLALFVVAATVVIEAVGAALLSFAYASHGYGWGDAIWHGVFHSISAFCNAGFALQSDSIVMFQEDPFALMVFSAIITLGGLGFLVMAGAFRSWRAEGRTPWSVQVKVVLWASLALVLAGWVLFLSVEWNASLAGLSAGDKVMNALFQSVTLRTAGFNSVDFGGLELATILAMLGFMYIGASPGSTGGGIKTTTAAVLLGGVRAIARGEPKVVLFNRRISQDIVYRSAAIAVVAVLIIGGGLFVLLLTEDLPFEMLAFEMVSAMATVGLSIGATGELSAAGKFVIIFVMFVGRIGPLTLALLLGGGKKSPVTYPKTRMMVG
jgi:trk system potassium uptake protein TrkH